MKIAETIMSFSHNDPVVNQSPQNPRLKDSLAIDKKSGRD